MTVNYNSGDGFGSLLLKSRRVDEEKNQCILHTKGFCFFCIASPTHAHVNNEGEAADPPKSLESLEHFLDLRILDVLQEKAIIGIAFWRMMTDRPVVDFQVTLCKECAKAMNTFSGLQNIQRKILESEESHRMVAFYQQFHFNPVGIDERTMFGRIVRAAILEKCSTKLRLTHEGTSTNSASIQSSARKRKTPRSSISTESNSNGGASTSHGGNPDGGAVKMKMEQDAFVLVAPSQPPKLLNTAQASAFINPATGKYKCDVCQNEFKSHHGFKEHYESIHLQIRYQCKLCQKEFIARKTFNVHYRSVHKGIRFPCQQCDKTFMYGSDVTKHVKEVHLGERRYGCDVCGSSFTRKGLLNEHMSKAHSS